MDPQIAALLLSVTPPALAIVYFAVFRQRDLHRDLYFFLGLISLTTFYIIALDPSVTAALYTSQGNYGFPILVTGLASLFLIGTLYFAGKSRRPVL